MNNKYTLPNAIKAVRNPSILYKEAKNFFWGINNRLFETLYSDGIDFMKEDWDNLIILDACRYDFFKQQNNIGGELNKKYSKGSNSGEFMRANFFNKELYDTVYITANPVWERFDQNVFHYYDFLYGAWDNELGMIPSEIVKKKTISAENDFPNKRIISHFMSPHTPYIGKKGMEFRECYGDPTPKVSITDDGIDFVTEGKHEEYIRRGELTKDKLEDFYSENLDLVLNHVEELVEILSGKTVVTADHGELLLERPLPFTGKKFTHPGIATSKLREVPWLVIDSDARKEVNSDPPIAADNAGAESIEQQLNDLGYRV